MADNILIPPSLSEILNVEKGTIIVEPTGSYSIWGLTVSGKAAVETCIAQLCQQRAQRWEEGAPQLRIWRAIPAWVQRKKEDIGKEPEYGQNQREGLEAILRDIEHRAKTAYASRWMFSTHLNDIEQSIQETLEQEYDLLCLHSNFHTDDDGRAVRCCIRKQLFKEMFEALPKLLWILEIRKLELKWEQYAQKLDIWRAIDTWAQRKREDIEMDQEDRWDQRQVLEEILIDIKHVARTASGWMIPSDPSQANDIGQSIEQAIDQESDRICQHPTSNTDIGQTLRCCIRKQLFEGMLEALPKLLRILEIRKLELEWEECVQKLDIWKAVLAWAQHKRKDIEKEKEYELNQWEALETILQDIECAGKNVLEWKFHGDPSQPNDVERSIMQAIEQEYDLLCQHSKSHTDDEGRMLRCCMQKFLFNEMLGKLPKLPPRILGRRKLELEWEECAPNSDVWSAILAWAEHKKEDVGKEQEYGWDQLKALGELLQDVENRAKADFTQPSGCYFYMVQNSIEGSITSTIEQEYDRLCHHPRLHTDGDGQMLRCCIRKQLFKEMLKVVPKLPLRIKIEMEWECAPTSAIWRAILAWAQCKMEDAGNGGGYRHDQQKALEEILLNIKCSAKTAFASRGVSSFPTDVGDIEQSIQHAIDKEYDYLCQHPNFHMDGEGGMPCCIRKQLFNEMLEVLPNLPPHVLELRRLEWKRRALKLGIWQAILAWAKRKKEDLGKEQEYGQDQQEALTAILGDTEHRAMATFLSNWSFSTDPNGMIDQSITNAIEEEHNLLCQHPIFHIDGDGQMLQCCIRKQLFNEMLGVLPKLPPRILEILQLRKFELEEKLSVTLSKIYRLSFWTPSNPHNNKLRELLKNALTTLNELGTNDYYHECLRDFLKQHTAFCAFTVEHKDIIIDGGPEQTAELCKSLRRFAQKLGLIASRKAEQYQSLYELFIANRNGISDWLGSAELGLGRSLVDSFATSLKDMASLLRQEADFWNSQSNKFHKWLSIREQYSSAAINLPPFPPEYNHYSTTTTTTTTLHDSTTKSSEPEPQRLVLVQAAQQVSTNFANLQKLRANSTQAFLVKTEHSIFKRMRETCGYLEFTIGAAEEHISWRSEARIPKTIIRLAEKALYVAKQWNKLQRKVKYWGGILSFFSKPYQTLPPFEMVSGKSSDDFIGRVIATPDTLIHPYLIDFELCLRDMCHHFLSLAHFWTRTDLDPSTYLYTYTTPRGIQCCGV